MTSQYQVEQTADTPLAWWRFEEAAGATTFAAAAGGVDLTASGSVTAGSPSPGPYPALGRGADFAGGRVTATSAAVASWFPRTVEVLVNLDSVPGTSSTARPPLYRTDGASGIIPLVLSWNIDGAAGSQGRLGFGWWTGSSYVSVNAAATALTAGLHHIVGVYETANILRIYVDGAEVATSGTVAARGSSTTLNTINVGARSDGTSPIDGRIHDLAIYNGALSADRVAAHWTAVQQVAGVTISDGGHVAFPDGVPTLQPYPEDTLSISDGGHVEFASDQLLAVTDGLPWSGYGELTSSPGGARQWWRYVASASGAVTVDTVGSGWNAAVTVYAADRSTVVAAGVDDPTQPAYGEAGYTGEQTASWTATAGTTYYVAVTAGPHATADSGRYVIGAVGAQSSDVTWSGQTPAPTPPPLPAAGPPPAGVAVVPLRRVSQTYPAPTLVDGRPQNWLPTSTSESDWGNFQVVVANVDVTYFRGFPVQINSYELAEPFGCGPAQITFPGITPHDRVGEGDTAWLIGGYTVDIVGPSGVLWSGFIGSQVGEYTPDRAGYTVDCVGELWMAETVGHQPRTYLPPVDVGSMVPVVLNLVPHRRVNGIAQVSTGIKTTQRGSADTSVIGYVQELLATAVTDDGTNQWTIARTGHRQYAMQLKDRTTMSWSVQTGQPGVEIKLVLDSTTSVNRVFGRGVAPGGLAWAGWVYPRTGIEAAPAYPYASPSTTIGIGDTDAGTASGTGVSDWQRRMNETGAAKLVVDGKFDAVDAAAAKKVQAAKGLTVDGIVGPQTWAATFDVGANGASLDAAYRAPLYALPGVTPNLTNADGSIGGANPSDNRNLIVVDRDEDFGDGITKAEAIRSAKAEVTRTNALGWLGPVWVGEIVLHVDPPEMSRWEIREGSNGTVKGWTGRDVPVHVAKVVAAPPVDGGSAGTVTLTVDEKARDLITLGAILRRDRDASRNPAMLPPRKQRRSQSRPDSVVEFDSESSGGIIPRFALFGGLWSVIRIPVSQAGKVAKVEATTTGPAARFTMACFGDAVTPADLTKWVGSAPLTARDDGLGPYDVHADQLATLGFVEAFGGPGQACGYHPGYETSPHNAGASPYPVTGKFVSAGAWSYQSIRPPWLWIAFWAASSCFVSGRIYPAPIDT